MSSATQEHKNSARHHEINRVSANLPSEHDRQPEPKIHEVEEVIVTESAQAIEAAKLELSMLEGAFGMGQGEMAAVRKEAGVEQSLAEIYKRILALKENYLRQLEETEVAGPQQAELFVASRTARDLNNTINAKISDAGGDMNAIVLEQGEMEQLEEKFTVLKNYCQSHSLEENLHLVAMFDEQEIKATLLEYVFIPLLEADPDQALNRAIVFLQETNVVGEYAERVLASLQSNINEKKGLAVAKQIDRLLETDPAAAARLYKQEKNKGGSLYMYGEKVDARVKEYAKKLLQDGGVKQALMFFRQLPDDRMGTREVAGIIYDAVEQGVSSIGKPYGDRDRIKEILKDFPDILIFNSSRTIWTAEDKWQFYEATGKLNNRREALTWLRLRDLPEDRRAEAAPQLFALNKEFGLTPNIFSQMEYFAADYNSLPQEERDRLVGNASYYDLLSSLDYISISTSQRDALIEKLLPESSDNKLVSPSNRKRLGVDAALVVDLLVEHNPAVVVQNLRSLEVLDGQENALVQRCYKSALTHSELQSIDTIALYSNLLLEHSEDNKFAVNEFLQNIDVSRYSKAAAAIEKIWGNGDYPKPVWHSALKRMESLQAHSAREDHDPWKTELDPLVKIALEKGILDKTQAADAEVLYDFVREYGMTNTPTILEWHKQVVNVQNISDITGRIRQAISVLLGKSVDTFSNKGFIGAEIKKFRQHMQSDLLDDKVPEAIFSSDAGLELFLQIKGSTAWEQKEEDPRAILRRWQTTLESRPELAELPEHFTERGIEIPLSVRKAEKLPGESSEREKIILGNKDLQLNVKRLKSAFAEALRISDLGSWWQSQSSQIERSIDEEMSKFSDRVGSAIGPARGSIEKQMAEWQGYKEDLASFDELARGAQNSEARIAEFLNTLTVNFPKRVRSKDDILRTVSVYHALRVMPENMKAAVRQLGGTESSKFDRNEVEQLGGLLVDYIYEHYLHPKQESSHIGHEPFSAQAVTGLKSAWGLSGKLEDSPVARANALFRKEEEGNIKISEKTIQVSLVPVRGPMRIYAGDAGDACYTSQHRELADGQFSRVTPFLYITGRNTQNERIRGSVLVIETQKATGEKVMVVRANNPQENLISQVDATSLNEKVIAELKGLAGLKGAELGVAFDRASQSSSNRPQVADFYQARYALGSKMELVNEPETNFNGYNSWNANGEHPVVSV